jgi:hypothetical protein
MSSEISLRVEPIRGRALKTRPPHRVRTSSTSRSLHLSKSIVLALEPAKFAGSHS